MGRDLNKEDLSNMKEECKQVDRKALSHAMRNEIILFAGS